MTGKNVIQIKSRIIMNDDVSVKSIKNVKKIKFRILLQCSCNNSKYLASITDDSVINYDEIIDAEETKTIPTNFDEISTICKTKNSVFYLDFY